MNERNRATLEREQVRLSVQRHLAPKKERVAIDGKKQPTIDLLDMLYSKITADPALLLNMPQLPENVFRDPATLHRPEDFSPEVKAWKAKVGATDIGLSWPISEPELINLFEVSARMKNWLRFYGTQGRSVFPPEHILNTLSLAVKEELYAEDITQEARLLLAKYFPEFVPTQPTQVYFSYEYQKEGERTASYEGMLRGKHYIRIDIRDNVYSVPQSVPSRSDVLDRRSTIDRDLDTIALVHELVHQKVAEVTEQNYDNDTYISDQEFADLPTYLLMQKAEEREGKEKGGFARTLFSTINEGLAGFIEMAVIDKRIRELKGKQNSNRRKALEKLKSDYLDLLKDYERRQYRAHYYYGLVMIEEMVRQFGEESLYVFVTSMDIEAIKKIERGSDEYEKIIKDATRIPRVTK
jgi:hypothetical protein